MNFGDYLRQLVKIVFTSSLALGLVIGIALLIVGETSMNFEIGLEIEMIDSLSVAVGLPLLAVIVFLAVSPLSIFIYRLLPTRRDEGVHIDA